MFIVICNREASVLQCSSYLPLSYYLLWQPTGNVVHPPTPRICTHPMTWRSACSVPPCTMTHYNSICHRANGRQLQGILYRPDASSASICGCNRKHTIKTFTYVCVIGRLFIFNTCIFFLTLIGLIAFPFLNLPEKFHFVLVPFDRVQCMATHFIAARKCDIIAKINNFRDI